MAHTGRGRHHAVAVAVGTLIAVVLAVLVTPAASAAAATPWPVGVAAAGHPAAKSSPTPAGPGAATAVCGSVPDLTVSWAVVAHATSYDVYQSSNGVAGTYSLAASTVTGTSWTGPFGLGTYYFKVSANIGANWNSALSVASNSRTLSTFLIFFTICS